MKKITMIVLAAVTMFVAACSSDDEAQKLTAQPESGWSEYITVEAGVPNDEEASNEQGSRRVAVNTDSPQKSLWEEGDKMTIWTGSTCSTTNMSEKGFELYYGAGTGSAKFKGQLVSTSAPTDETKLIAIIDNENDAVDASAGNSVSVDLSEQEGATAATALDYELFYGTSTNVRRAFSFTNKMVLIKWTIQVNGVDNGDMCDIVLSGAGLKNAATLDPATGELTTPSLDGTITLKDVVLDLNSSNRMALYVVLPPCTLTSGITATLTMTSGAKQKYLAVGSLGSFTTATLAGNKYYTAGPNEFTPQVINNYAALQPGDVIYSDLAHTTPIAITVFQEGGHGYAIALNDCTPANTGVAASAGSNQYDWRIIADGAAGCTRDNSSALTFAEAFASTAANAKDWTNQLAGKTCEAGTTHTHHAAQVAKRYNVAIPADAPEGAQWVLPSAGMWIEFFNQSNTGYSVTSSGITSGGFGTLAGGDTGVLYEKVQSFWTDKCSSFIMMGSSSVAQNYWTSSEYTDANAVCVSFRPQGFMVGNSAKTGGFYVRSFLVF